MNSAVLGTTQQMALCWEPVAMEEAGHPEEQSESKEIMQNLAWKQLPVWKHLQSSCCQNLWNSMPTQNDKCQNRLTRAWQLDHEWRSHAIGQQQYGSRSGTIWHPGLLWISLDCHIPCRKPQTQTSCCHMLSANEGTGVTCDPTYRSPIGHLRPYPLKTRNTVTCDPTSFYCAHHTKLHLVTCDPTHHY